MDYQVYVPQPDLSADNHRESCNCDDDDFSCENCGHEFSVTLCSGICGGDGEIHDLEDDDLLDVSEHFPEDDWDDIPDDFYPVFIDSHVNEINDAIAKLDGLDENTQKLLYRNLFANVISCLEAYLSDTAISRIKNSDYNKRRFVESSKFFQEQTFTLSDIYRRLDKMDNAIMQRLKDIIYHNLNVVKPLYKCTFDVDLGDISYLMKAIQKRHDIVHRNGKDKDGNVVSITKEDVKELVAKVSEFIQYIETQFRTIDFDCPVDASYNDIEDLFDNKGNASK